MTRLLAPMAVAVAVAALLSASVPSARACSCAALSPQEYVDNADVVAIGMVVETIDAEEQMAAPNEESDQSLPDVDAVVSVERYLKGSGPAEITVDDPPSGGSCGFFGATSLGQRYLLFLTGDASPLQTNLCSGSTQLVDQEANRQFLAQVEALTAFGGAPDAAPAPSQSDADVPWLAIGLGSGLGAALLLAASITLVRRRIIGGG